MFRSLFLFIVAASSVGVFAQNGPPGFDLSSSGIRIEPDKRVMIVLATLEQARVPEESDDPAWMEVLEAFLGQLTDAEARAARFRHPIGGWVTAGQGVAFLAGHIGHHARQLERIRRAAGFPAV